MRRQNRENQKTEKPVIAFCRVEVFSPVFLRILACLVFERENEKKKENCVRRFRRFRRFPVFAAFVVFRFRVFAVFTVCAFLSFSPFSWFSCSRRFRGLRHFQRFSTQKEAQQQDVAGGAYIVSNLGRLLYIYIYV